MTGRKPLPSLLPGLKHPAGNNPLFSPLQSQGRNFRKEFYAWNFARWKVATSPLPSISQLLKPRKKINMKKYLSIIGAAVFLFAVTNAKAQIYAVESIVSGYIVQAGATSNVVATLDCRKQQQVAISWLVTGSTNTAFGLDASVDGTNWKTNWATITGITSGVPMITNVNVTGFGYLRVNALVNTGSIIGTNTATYGIKIGAP